MSHNIAKVSSIFKTQKDVEKFLENFHSMLIVKESSNPLFAYEINKIYHKVNMLNSIIYHSNARFQGW